MPTYTEIADEAINLLQRVQKAFKKLEDKGTTEAEDLANVFHEELDDVATDLDDDVIQLQDAILTDGPFGDLVALVVTETTELAEAAIPLFLAASA
jgi:hypothetical protein